MSVAIYGTWSTSYRSDPRTGKKKPTKLPQFTLSYYEPAESGQKRKLLKFSSLAEAEAEAEQKLDAMARGEVKVLNLSGADRETYLAAMQQLKAWDPDARLEPVVAEYISCRKKLTAEGSTLSDAIDTHVARNKAVTSQITIPKLVEEFIARKEKDGLSDEYLNDCKRLLRFGEAFQMRLSELKLEQLQVYMDNLCTVRTGEPVAARTKKNTWGLVSTLIRYGVKKKYGPKDLLDLLEEGAVSLPKVKKSKTAIWEPEEFAEMLATARPATLPWLVVGGYAGLRQAEIRRLNWTAIALDEGHVIADSDETKTGVRKIVPLCDAAIAWLRPLWRPNGKIAAYSEENKLIAAVKADVEASRRKSAESTGAAFIPFSWRRNGLRHSWASMRLAITDDAAKTALEAGHSPRILLNIYRKLVTKSQAERWFSIFPDKDAENVVPMRAAGA